MNLAIIPARGGSKRIPRKNIKPFAGKPIIAYAIQAAKECKLFDRILVSTEDKEIAAIAKGFGTEVPFLRPSSLADDYAGTNEVVAHAIQAWGVMNQKIDMVCCIYPGTPFLKPNDIKDALHLLKNTPTAQYSFPVAEFPSTIQRALRRKNSGLLESFYPEYEQMRTQDLEQAFYDAGQFYWGHRLSWLSNPKIHNSGVGLIIPKWRAVDLDTPQDWERAERMFEAQKISGD